MKRYRISNKGLVEIRLWPGLLALFAVALLPLVTFSAPDLGWGKVVLLVM
jgi:hypothetical protein